MIDHRFDDLEPAAGLGPVHDDSPLAIWRRKTSMEITQADLDNIRDRLAIFAGCREPHWADAIAGDVACAMHIAGRLVHPSPVPGRRLDMAMSSLLVCGMRAGAASLALAALLRCCAAYELVSLDLPLSWLASAMFHQDPVRAAEAMPTLRRLGWPIGKSMPTKSE
jgi:hypothetical protein